MTADPIQGYIYTLTNSLTNPVYKIDRTYLNGSQATTSTTAGADGAGDGVERGERSVRRTARAGSPSAASRYNYIGEPFNAVVEVKETYQYAG